MKSKKKNNRIAGVSQPSQHKIAITVKMRRVVGVTRWARAEHLFLS